MKIKITQKRGRETEIRPLSFELITAHDEYNCSEFIAEVIVPMLSLIGYHPESIRDGFIEVAEADFDYLKKEE